jgi:hypothetical protein
MRVKGTDWLAASNAMAQVTNRTVKKIVVTRFIDVHSITGLPLILREFKIKRVEMSISFSSKFLQIYVLSGESSIRR